MPTCTLLRKRFESTLYRRERGGPSPEIGAGLNFCSHFDFFAQIKLELVAAVDSRRDALLLQIADARLEKQARMRDQHAKWQRSEQCASDACARVHAAVAASSDLARVSAFATVVGELEALHVPALETGPLQSLEMPASSALFAAEMDSAALVKSISTTGSVHNGLSMQGVFLHETETGTLNNIVFTADGLYCASRTRAIS